MAPRRKTTGPQDDFIRAGVLKGWGATQIDREMQKCPALVGDVSITLRTIQNRVREFTADDASGPWSLMDADPDEPALVLDVVLLVNRLSEGRLWLSKATAGKVAQLRRADPDIPPGWAYSLAIMHQSPWGRDDNTMALDLLTAAAPWRRTGTPEEWGLWQPQPGPPDLTSLVRLLAAIALDFCGDAGDAGPVVGVAARAVRASAAARRTARVASLLPAPPARSRPGP